MAARATPSAAMEVENAQAEIDQSGAVLGTGIRGGGPAGGRAGKGDLGPVVQPRVAKTKMATRGQKAEVVDLAAVRRKRQKTQRSELATRGQKTLTKKGSGKVGKPYVEAVGASVGTMAFRLRWRENGKRQPPIYLSRVSKEVFEIIKQGNYEAFKEQLVVSHFAGAVRAGNTA